LCSPSIIISYDDNILLGLCYWEKHGVTASECKQIFFNHPLVSGKDLKHSKQEYRYYALGHTDGRRHLFVVFTIRNRLIRVISARDMNRKERKVYESL